MEEPVPSEPRQQWIKFDRTVNWPMIISIGTGVVAAWGFGDRVLGQGESLEKTMILQSNEVKTLSGEVKTLAGVIKDIQTEMARREGDREILQDHEGRLRILESK